MSPPALPWGRPSGRAARVALVPAAGSGSRSGSALPKQYVELNGRSLLEWTVLSLLGTPGIDAVFVVVSDHDRHYDQAVKRLEGARVYPLRSGGATRAESVLNGLQALAPLGVRDDDWVLVHDAARCLVRSESVARLIAACESHEVAGGLLAMPVADTLKRAAGSGAQDMVGSTVDRACMWAAQTPQMFRCGTLRSSLQQALQAGVATTDEASAVEHAGGRVLLVPGEADNFKITYPGDFQMAQTLLAARTTPAWRIGQGWDIHALVPGRPLILGGVKIEHAMGLLGHSDADALLHAITDALLGAAGLGDIGRHFPDTDPALEGADSAQLLRRAVASVQELGWRVVNVDCTVIAQSPRLAAHVGAMRERIAACVGLSADEVNVKAKTSEKMGAVGEGRAIEAQAVCLLTR